MAEQIAQQDWHRRAIVRIRETVTCHAPDQFRSRTFQPGEEGEMVQWDRKGRPVDGAWWTSYDVDGAYILDADKVEVIRIIEEVTPWQP